MLERHQIKTLNKEIEFEELEELFNWDIDHWVDMMSGATPKQLDRFKALELTYKYNQNMERRDKALEDLKKFLDEFNVERLIKQ